MNVTKPTSLKVLSKIYDTCREIGAQMIATDTGFKVTRLGSTNPTLRKVLLEATDNEAVKYAVQGAWGCGSEMDGGLHFSGF